jgi:hypothetical protein
VSEVCRRFDERTTVRTVARRSTATFGAFW